MACEGRCIASKSPCRFRTSKVFDGGQLTLLVLNRHGDFILHLFLTKLINLGLDRGCILQVRGQYKKGIRMNYLHETELEKQAVIEESVTGELSPETVHELEQAGYFVGDETALIEHEQAIWHEILADTAKAAAEIRQRSLDIDAMLQRPPRKTNA